MSPLRRAIIEGRDANSLHTLAAQSGMPVCLKTACVRVAGTTTLDELARVTIGSRRCLISPGAATAKRERSNTDSLAASVAAASQLRSQGLTPLHIGIAAQPGHF